MKLPRLNPGANETDTVRSASWMNRIIDGLNGLFSMNGDNFIQVQWSGGVPSIRLNTGALGGVLPHRQIHYGKVQQYPAEATGVGWKATVVDGRAEVQLKQSLFDGSAVAGDTISVYCYHSISTDPNIRKDMVIAYTRADNFDWITVNDYSDDKIGTIKLWSPDDGETPPAPENIPDGWALCDGTNGTRDLRGLFVAGYAATGKKLRDTAGAAIAASAATWYKCMGSCAGGDVHGKSDTANNHPDHNDHFHHTDAHRHCIDKVLVCVCRCPSNGSSIPVSPQDTQFNYPPCCHQTSGVRMCPSSATSAILRHAGDTGGLAHPFTPAGFEQHPLNDTDNRPRYMTLAYIQRVF